MRLGDAAAVALGGCMGAWARVGLDLALTAHLGVLAASTVCVNLAGALALGVLTGWMRVRPLPTRVRLAAGTGFCGAFTTYSSLTLVLAHPTPGEGLAQVVLLLGLGVVVAWGGLVLGTRVAGVPQ